MNLIETKFQLWRFVGLLFVTIGIVGLGYIGWVYGIWVRTLPDFPQDSELLTAFTEERSENVVGLGFGNILVDAVTPTPIIAFNDIAINRPVLGTQDVAPVVASESVTLTIPALNLKDVTVALDVNGSDESIYDTVLTQAVAHLQNSALPGKDGNTFLFGHSKLPIFAGTDYESIFTNLPKVKTGDVVMVTYLGEVYTYQIKQTGIVDPSAVYVMHQPQNKKMITLMTCIPPGFDHQRFITVGELMHVAKA